MFVIIFAPQYATLAACLMRADAYATPRRLTPLMLLLPLDVAYSLLRLLLSCLLLCLSDMRIYLRYLMLLLPPP